MATPSRDIVVSVTSKMSHRYTFVPKGNPYMTLNCRRKAREEDYDVYVVKDSKGKSLGLRVPTAIFEQVQEKFEQTREKRAQSVKRTDEKAKTEFSNSVRKQFPKIPAEDVPKIVERAMEKHSGRIGRTMTLGIGEKARLGVRAYIRHKYTEYDNLLKNGVSRNEARIRIYEVVDKIVSEWGGSFQEEIPKTVDYSTDDVGKKLAQRTNLKNRFAMKSRLRLRKMKGRSERSASAPPLL
ncbi:uncharacterized protein GGS22DRAFT_194737 [Annulohypoxylon maeteangense]|uniref:uncharacterized protein n=1 Tax=Annulohypoxylon maeteangense TaxID=1927788 RepID=UPI002007A88B|nr:uncharacterized protein GGS22DRAFT_194737 [Annulohypoxylon maeteangense]KAI0884124.1 hypothetical protein GGS22DRAFT_194737 [Annulohypoxylon maeteangense]